MARAAKSPARARPKGYAAPTNGKATKKSSAARTSTKFLLVALVVLYATPSSLLLLSNPLLFFAIGAHNFMGILNFYYTCEPVNSVCAKVHDRLMTFLIEQSKVPGPHQVVASFLEFWIGYFPKDAFNARDLTKCPEVNKIFGIEVEPRFCTPTNVDGQQDDTTGDEYKAK